MARKSNKAVQNQLMSKLAELGGEIIGQDDIVFDGTEFRLPESLSLKQSVEYLVGKLREQGEEYNDSRVYPLHPLDLAQAVDAIIREYFGTVTYKAPGLFDSVTLSSITVDIGVTVQMPISTWFEVPTMPGISLLVTANPDDPTAGVIYARGLLEHRAAVQGFFELVAQNIERHSAYKGKPWRGIYQPEFFDLRGFDPAQFFYSEEAQKELGASLWGPIAFPITSAFYSLPIKRSVLLKGPFGTGKSGAGLITAKIAQTHGVTFLAVRPGEDDFSAVVKLAARYAPAIVFVEDIDTVASSEEEAERISEMLDILDGLEAKTARAGIMLVMTTNHADALHKGVLRPGRIDATIEIGLPDATAIRGISSYILGEMAADWTDENWSDIAGAMDGFLPAFVAEASTRSIRYAVTRAAVENGVSFYDEFPEDPDTPGPTLTPEMVKLTAQDLVDSAHGLRPQLLLMLEARTEPNRSAFDVEMRRLIREAVDPSYDEFGTIVGANSAILRDQLNDDLKDAKEAVVEEVHDTAYDRAYDGGYEGVRDR